MMDVTQAPLWSVLLSSVIGPCLVVALGALLNRKVNAIRHEVTNKHDANLRDDLDSKQDETRRLIGEVKKDVGGLRQEIRQERAERFELGQIVHHLQEARDDEG